MTESAWGPFDSGSTVGTSGTEDGVIVADDEHSAGARITLERDCRIATFAITCGIYGAMVHTRFFNDETHATQQFDEMKAALADICEQPDAAAGDDVLASFVHRYP